MVTLERSYEAARLLTRHHAKSFYFSSHLLPKRKRRRAYAIYACCRYIDDEIDLSPDTASKLTAITKLREFLHEVYHQRSSLGSSELEWVTAFTDTVDHCEVPEAYFQDLLTGVEMDQEAVRVQTWNELEKYCYHVAGVVGLMMTRIFELKDRRYEKEAIQLGNAMQLTNILRDIAEDYERDRIYLPEEELQQFNLSESDIAKGEADERWEKLMKFQIERARYYYQESEKGIYQLDQDGSQRTVWVMRDVYAGILDAIERADYQVFKQRCHVTFLEKCQLALSGYHKQRAVAA
ncbi:MAG: phytoene/squalene synthase family protein [Verrucomicrobiota bacterium]